MANATPAPTPNPNAVKFELDTTLGATLSYKSAEEAAADPFAAAVFEGGGVASLFGVNDFVTVTREPDADWDELVPRVVDAAEQHL